MLVLLNATADLKAFKSIDIKNIDIKIKEHTKEAMQQLLEKYLSKWEFKDLYSLHIIGKIISLFAKELHLEHLAVAIADHCYNEYERFRLENPTGDNSIKSQLAFFLHGALTFYTEEIT